MEIEAARYGWASSDGIGRFDPATDSLLIIVLIQIIRPALANSVWAIYQDRSGTLWLGTWGGALIRFDDKTKTFVNYTPDPRDPHRLNGGDITGHSRRPDWNIVGGSAWMDCTGSTVKMERFTRYTESQGLPSSSDSGHSGRRGRQALAQHQEGDIPVRSQDWKRSRNYDMSDGLQSNEFSDGCYHKAGWRDVLWRQQWV